MPDPIQTGAGAKISIGSNTPAADQAAYEAETWVQINELSDIGEFGDTRNLVTFLSLSDGRVRKARGAADAGDATVTYAFLGTDAGQIALRAAFAQTSQTQDQYNFRVELPDGETTPTTFYFPAKVLSDRQQTLSNEGVVTRIATLAINDEIIEVAAT